MQFNFLPLHDWILVEAIKDPETTIVIVESYKKIYRAKVIYTGMGQLYPVYRPKDDTEFANPNVHRISEGSQIKVGDTVMFPQHVAYHIKIDGKYYILVKDQELYGVIENE